MFSVARAGVLMMALTLPAQGGELQLLMVETPGCAWCARWDAEIAPQYPLTDEGRAAPLLRTRLREPVPEGVVLARPATFTPTFVLLSHGQETGRLEGYPGPDFFWPLVQELIRKAGQDPPDDP